MARRLTRGYDRALGGTQYIPALAFLVGCAYVTLAWAAIVGLLSAETPQARQLASQAFADLPHEDRTAFLTYVEADRIEHAHPQL